MATTQMKRTFHQMDSSVQDNKPNDPLQKGVRGLLNILLTKKEKENDKGYLGYPLDTMYEVVNIESQGEVRVKRVSDDVERDYVIRENTSTMSKQTFRRETRTYLRFVRNTGRGLGRKKYIRPSTILF